MARRILALLTLPILGIALTACPKKPEEAVEAGALDAAVVVLVNPADDAAVAQFDAGSSANGTAGGTTAKPAAVDSGAAIATTAASAEPAASAVPVAAGECCCELPGQQLASLPQSDCAKVKHGKCVKKDRCAEPAARPVDGSKSCCCDVNGTKSIIGQSECARGGQGKCIKMHECKGR